MTTVDTLVDSYLQRLDAAAARLPADRREELLGEIREHIDGARAAGAAADEAAVRTLLDRLGEPEEIVAYAIEDIPSNAGASAPSGGSATYAQAGTYAAPGPYDSPYSAGTVPPSTTLETAACLMLTVGSLLPVVGWLVGLALLCSSRRWTVREKLLGALVVPGGPGLLLYLGAVVPGQTCSVSAGGGFGIATVAPDPSLGVPALPAPTVPQDLGSTETCTGGLPFPGYVAALLALVLLAAPVVVAVILHRRARARAALEPPRAVQPGGSGWGGLEVAAVLLIGLGSFVVPVAGTVAGLVCLFLSQRWTAREKTVATLLTVVPSVFGLALVLSAFAFPLSGRF